MFYVIFLLASSGKFQRFVVAARKYPYETQWSDNFKILSAFISIAKTLSPVRITLSQLIQTLLEFNSYQLFDGIQLF